MKFSRSKWILTLGSEYTLSISHTNLFHDSTDFINKLKEIQEPNVLKMIETVLENNVFQFGDIHFIQTEGVANGSRLGKNFACTYMRKWDEQLMNAPKRPVFYKRFIDDGFGLWVGNKEELLEFVRYANKIMTTSKSNYVKVTEK